MAAVAASLLARDGLHQLVKRKNWAARNPGVTLVFAIVGVVGIGLIALWISKCLKRRKETKPNS